MVRQIKKRTKPSFVEGEVVVFRPGVRDNGPYTVVIRGGDSDIGTFLGIVINSNNRNILVGCTGPFLKSRFSLKND